MQSQPLWCVKRSTDRAHECSSEDAHTSACLGPHCTAPQARNLLLSPKCAPCSSNHQTRALLPSPQGALHSSPQKTSALLPSPQGRTVDCAHGPVLSAGPGALAGKVALHLALGCPEPPINLGLAQARRAPFPPLDGIGDAEGRRSLGA